MEVEIKGTEEMAQKLKKIGDKAYGIEKRALYAGAKIVADEIKARLREMPAQNNLKNLIAYNKKEQANLSYLQKEGLISGFGLSGMGYMEGRWYVVAGFNGYNKVVTKKWPQGQPNSMIAAVVEKGTSFFPANPFFKRSINSTKAAMTAAMQIEVDRSINQMK